MECTEANFDCAKFPRQGLAEAPMHAICLTEINICFLLVSNLSSLSFGNSLKLAQAMR